MAHVVEHLHYMMLGEGLHCIWYVQVLVSLEYMLYLL